SACGRTGRRSRPAPCGRPRSRPRSPSRCSSFRSPRRPRSAPQCQYEFNSFLTREAALERHDLIFPILYIRVGALGNERQGRNPRVPQGIGPGQYVDWRPLRHLDVNSTEVKREVGRFCEQIVKALQKPWLPPEERARRAEDAARRAREAEEQRRAEE